MKKTALFDLDGVVIDTEGQYTEFWTAVGMRDFPDMPDFALKIKGNTLKQIEEQYYSQDTAASQRLKAELDAFEAAMDYPYVSGVKKFLEELHNAGFQTAVVTSSNQAKMTSLYRKRPEIQGLFDRIFTAEDAARSKPAPDCYINAAHKMGVAPEECYVFEDSLSGLQAGRDSGAVVIGLTTTNSAEKIRKFCSITLPDFDNFTVARLKDIE